MTRPFYSNMFNFFDHISIVVDRFRHSLMRTTLQCYVTMRTKEKRIDRYFDNIFSPTLLLNTYLCVFLSKLVKPWWRIQSLPVIFFSFIHWSSLFYNFITWSDIFNITRYCILNITKLWKSFFLISSFDLSFTMFRESISDLVTVLSSFTSGCIHKHWKLSFLFC